MAVITLPLPVVISGNQELMVVVHGLRAYKHVLSRCCITAKQEWWLSLGVERSQTTVLSSSV